ncbi:hypothetical protein LSH36_749g00005 [Paralvinella palmiformis]|uniref:Uncharacterized protein n=1 Tax=Paralvinella palmiformis TaxID=53620 RepID=A0AAD9J1S2_9ANNE|nr:hypothetical protein LSH36_749g00005 [Paralvinella palmiformis]
MAFENKDIRRELDLASVCDGNMIKLLTSHLQAVGVPKEYIFFPLLSITSSFLGQSTVKISDEWSESCSLWTAVVARKGSKRSTILDRFMTALLAFQREEANGQSTEQEQSLSSDVKVTCDEALVGESFRDGRRHLGLFEDLSTSKIMEKDNLKLAKQCYDGRPRHSSDAHSTLGLFSFLPPEDALSLLEDRNIDLSSRFLVACPKSSVFKSADIKCTMPSNTPSLTRIFEILNTVHAQPLTYDFSPQAKTAFDSYYDILQDGMVRFDRDERNYCILAKAAGQLARLTASLAALSQAVKAVVYRQTVSPANWNVEIKVEHVEAGKLIMDYAIDIRFTLLSRVAAFRTQQLYSAPGQQRAVGYSAVMLQATKEPPMKRARIAAADTGQGGAVVASSLPASADLHNNNNSQMSTAVGQNAIDQSTMARNANNANVCQTSGTEQLPGFSSTFTASLANDCSANSASYTPPTPGQAECIPTQGYFSNCPVEDDEYYLPGRRNSSYIDCSMLSPDELGGFSEEQQKFIRRFGYKVKKLLEFRQEYRVSPSCCAQRHLMPPIPKMEMTKYDTQTRYPVMAAKEYLAKVAELGFGTIESTWHATNNRRSIIFNKLPYDKLTSRARNLMARLQVDVNEYMAAFVSQHDNIGYYGADPFQIGAHPSPIDGQISSSTSVKYPVPYPCLQDHSQIACDKDVGVLTIFPENPEESPESSPSNSASGLGKQHLVKSEPLDTSLEMDDGKCY